MQISDEVVRISLGFRELAADLHLEGSPAFGARAELLALELESLADYARKVELAALGTGEGSRWSGPTAGSGQ